VVLVFLDLRPTFLSVACFKRNTKIERQVFHLTLILSFSQKSQRKTNYVYNNPGLEIIPKLYVVCTDTIPVNWTRLRRNFGLLLLVVSLVVLAWGLRPLPTQTRRLALSLAEMLPVELPPGSTADLSASIGSRVLLLEWPSVIRIGDTAAIRLVLNPAKGEGSSSQASQGLGEAYAVLAEARLELPGIPHTPMGEVSQALLPGSPVMFLWNLQPSRAGDGNGTVWLHLSFIPNRGGQTLRQVLTAQRIEIRVIDFLGLGGPWARALASAGVVVGAVLGLDAVLIWFWSRTHNQVGG
jgi:hypothetical protein